VAVCLQENEKHTIFSCMCTEHPQHQSNDAIGIISDGDIKCFVSQIISAAVIFFG